MRDPKLKFNAADLTYLALLTAMQVVLSRFLSFNTLNLKIGFAFLPVAVGAAVFGPLGGAIVGGLGDFLGAVLFPIGPYFPGFTLTTALSGVAFGLAIHRSRTPVRIVAAVLFHQLVLSFLLNTLWIHLLYGTPVPALMATRIWQCAGMIPVEILVVGAMSPVLGRIKRHPAV